ncbi:hypothetical protein [Lysobacter humi (ex Lee et al. 2017)]
MKHRILLYTALALAAALDASAATRYGVVTEMTPIENRGSDENPEVGKRRQLGAAVGGLVGNGLALLGARTGRQSDATAVAVGAAPTVGAKVGEKIGGPGPSTQYMVKVRLDRGKVLSINQKRVDLAGVEVGSRVRVEGSGSDARIQVEPGGAQAAPAR